MNFAHQLEMQCQLINLGSFNWRLRNNWRDFEEIVLTGGREIIGKILKKIVLIGGREIIGEILKK